MTYRDTIPCPPPAKPIKVCACGRAYSPAEWCALPFVGIMRDDVETLELRNCTCGSTLAIVTSSVAVALYADDEITERITIAEEP